MGTLVITTLAYRTLEVTSPELPSWVLGVPFLVIGAVLVRLAWRRRGTWAAAELQRFSTATGLPDPGADRDVVLERIGARLGGRLLGVSAVTVIAALLMAGELSSGESGSGLWLLLIPFGHVVGTALGHLRPVGMRADEPRVAALRERSLSDYVTAPEIRIAQFCAALPVLTIALALLHLVAGTPSPTPALVAIAAGIFALVLVAWLTVLIGRALRQHIATRGPTGLAWAELLRAQMLRDLVGGAAFAGWFGGAFVLLWGVTSSWRGFPDWYLPVAVSVMVVSVAALLVAFVIGAHDKALGWARKHVLSHLDGRVHP